uniref:Uncharacterized protein n=1 Tax=Mycolicibacterium neoaurum VKM Ac-1815D TaxID=700508 RepID=V5XJJ7_MYCNE
MRHFRAAAIRFRAFRAEADVHDHGAVAVLMFCFAVTTDPAHLTSVPLPTDSGRFPR